MRRIIAPFICLGLALAWIGWAASQTAGSASEAASAGEVVRKMPPAPAPAAPLAAQAPQMTISEKVKSLSLRERVGQLMLLTLQGSPAPDTSDMQFLARYTPGGIIIPAVVSPESAAGYVAIMRRLPFEIKTGIPVLVGANLYDLPLRGWMPGKFFAPLPSLLSIAAANDPQVTQHLGKLIASQLSAMGITMHMGPTLELAPPLPEFKGSIHCLGGSPEFAAKYGCALIQSLAGSGVLAVPMGFPGGGLNRTVQKPAVLLTPREALPKKDLLPYARAIETGTPIMHVGNTLVPTLDEASGPASLSATVMRDLLRGKLGFKGVILAGPMDNGDITRIHDASDAAILSIKAGADMIYWCGPSGQRVMKTIDEMVHAVETGALSVDLINAAAERVLDLKSRLNLAQRPVPNPKQAAKISRKGYYPKEAYMVERRSITLVQNHDNVLPLATGKSQPVGITGVIGVEALYDSLRKRIKSVVEQPIPTAKYGGQIMDFEVRRLTDHAAGIRTAVCIFTSDLKLPGQVDLVNKLKAVGARVVVVLIGYPDNLQKLAMADAILLAYCDPKASEAAMKAVADILVGEGPVGVLPFKNELRISAGKAETFNAMDVIRVPAGILPVTVGPSFVAGQAVSYDPILALKKVLWEFGDGKKAKGMRVEKIFDAPGRYPVTITVTDSKSDSTSGTVYAVVE